MTSEAIRFRRHNDYKRHIPGESLTVQAAALECDINNVVRRLMAGHDPGVPINQGSYRDNTGHVDLKTNLDVLRRHQSAFNELPDEVRAKYKTPSEYYDAQHQALLQQAGTSNPLDVSGPTDSNGVAVSSNSSGRKPSETKSPRSKTSQNNIQEGDRGQPEE